MSDASPSFRSIVRERWSEKNRYGLVLLLILVTYGVSVENTGSVGAAAVLGVQLATVWIVFTVTGSRRARRAAGIALILIAVIGVVGGIAGSATDTDIAGLLYGLNTLLYFVAPVLILAHLVRRRKIDIETFLGAIAAYLLLGMMFAFAYRTVGHFQSGPFFGTSGDGNMSDDLFFSFITLTTTGYGNLVPAGNPGQSMAVLEAVLGQLFLVTAVAKIVTGWTPTIHPRLAGGAPEAGGADPTDVVAEQGDAGPVPSA